MRMIAAHLRMLSYSCSCGFPRHHRSGWSLHVSRVCSCSDYAAQSRLNVAVVKSNGVHIQIAG